MRSILVKKKKGIKIPFNLYATTYLFQQLNVSQDEALFIFVF